MTDFGAAPQGGPQHGPPADDFSRLADPDQWMGWLGDDPARAVRDSLTDCLAQQAPGAVVEWVEVTDRTSNRMSARRDPDDEEMVVITRIGLLVPFALAVTAPGRARETLTGILTWVAAGLDRPGARKDQVWMDLRATMPWAEDELEKRMFLVGDPALRG
ncbi:hypothetical protein Kpho02_31290 [Kitasatospora phosalacinea]|uniref:Uncharacterized protein n=1 Tax=Kitasatospora phosalacinea TaxID=2065 RepID=A0A9W6Q5Y0_9ACTN|nr:hypothetical protein [Kitasatospora phosalacinea]GLW70830.1 hypothetical protein Kpho02_31290 [Kitasatospora phosalacinea]